MTAAPRIRWDVITTAANGDAYETSFHNESTARAFADAMEAHGYSAEVMDIYLYHSLADALFDAAGFYGDPILGQSGEGIDGGDDR